MAAERVEVAEARDLAWVFLHRDADRWRHVQAAAARADELRPAVSADERGLLVAAAWLHDIGYCAVLREVGFHPLDGARYIRSAGHPRLAGLVAHHSGARFVADYRGLREEMAAYPFVQDALTDALTYADQTAGPTGQRLTVAQRLADTARRHGPDAPNTRVRQLREPYILGAAARTELRLRAHRTAEP